jgi:ribonuclease R
MDSKARVTYGEAQEIIDGNDVPKFSHVKDAILRLADLAKILMAKRFKEGSLDLEIPDTELVIDGAGVPIDIQRSERLFSHRLIEEMMLAANVAVAKFLSGKEIPALYRIHEPPNEDAIRTLEKYLANFGGTTKLGQGKLQKRLTKALQEFEGKPEAAILNILTLRSMSQAKYNMNNLGHFGLGFEFYTHFTSPIRRYPDLIVHRLIKSQIMKNSQYRLMTEDDLSSAGTILSAAEQRSVKAERQVQSIKKARFMSKFVGQEFEGMISSVAKFGIFVILRQYDIDGLVRVDDLGKEYFEYDEDNLRLVAKRSGFSYSIGDMVRIQVASADPELGQINFVLAGAELEDDDERSSSEKSAEGYLKKLHSQNKKRRENDDEDVLEDRRSGQDRRRGDRRNDDDRQPQQQDRSQQRGRHEDRKAKSGDRKDRGPKRFEKKEPPKMAPAGQKSKFFRDSRNEENGQEEKQQKARANFRPEPRPDNKGPDKQLLDMILGPDRYRQETGESSAKDNKPKLSKKLMFAENSKLRDNDQNSEKNSDSLKDRDADKQNAKKRGKTANNRGSVRKTRVSSSRGKGKAR